MLKVILKQLIALWLLSCFFVTTGQHVEIKSKPGWVKDLKPEFEASPTVESAGGFYYLLIDQQENVSREERYGHYAYKILTTEGVQEMSDLSLTYDPSYETLSINQLTIHRNGNVIDQLKSASINTIQREESMDRHLYDGSLTAAIHFKDVRVGDVIEYAYTFKGYNPIFEGHYSKRIDLNYHLPYHKLLTRILIPSNKKVEFKLKNEAKEPIRTQQGNLTEYSWELNDVSAVLSDNNVPSWYDAYQHVRITDYNNWSEVIKWADKHFKVNSSEKEKFRQRLAEFEKEKVTTDEDLILSIIRFVQDDIRYLGFESGLNAYKPHSPVEVYDQRFGDCKDKSLLLVTMLNHYNVAAYPMLVNTQLRGQLSEVLPAGNIFDHCVVAVELQDGTFYIDPTISNQGGGLKNIYFPSYGYGLVIKEGERELRKLPEAGMTSIVEDQSYTLGKVDGEASLTIETTYKGSDADSQRSYFASNRLETIQKSYVSYLANVYSDVTPVGIVEYSDDRKENKFVVIEKYQIAKFWKADESIPEQVNAEFYPLPLESYVNVSKTTQRTAPYYLSYPVSYKHIINVSLPEDWAINNEEKNITGDGYRYTYKASYDDRYLTLERHYQTYKGHIAPESVPKFIEDHQSMLNSLSYIISFNKAFSSGFKFSWASLFLGIIVLGVAAYGCYHLYYNYDPQPKADYEHGKPIGGWLILIGIGLFLTPLRLLYDIATTQEFFNGTTWSILFNQARWPTILVMGLEFIYNIIYLIFSVLVLLLFLNRRSSLPRLISFYYGVSFLMTLLDSAAGSALGSAYTSEEYKEIARTFIVAVIWIPYFNISSRVKTTFIERVNINNDPDPDPDKTLTYTLNNKSSEI